MMICASSAQSLVLKPSNSEHLIDSFFLLAAASYSIEKAAGDDKERPASVTGRKL